MLIAHKIALAPNHKQASYFARAAGTARFAYNWALAEWQKQYAAHQQDPSLAKPSQQSLRRKLNSIKKEQFPWMLAVTKNAPQMAIIHLGKAYQNFFAGRAKYPTFRKKGVHDRFSLTNDQFSVDESRIRIPNLGWVRMREALRFKGKIMSATVSRVADRWFVSITVELQANLAYPKTENQGAAVGVDLGVSTFATLSTGETVTGPKAHKSRLSRLKRVSRGLSRKQRGSKNRQKAKIKLSKLHAKISNIRRDSLHQLTTALTRRFGIIGIEDLNITGMMKNRHLSRAVADMGFYEFRRQLDYKAKQRSCHIIVAERWYPSSKLCSACGFKLEQLTLAIREWVCPRCGAHHYRDVNAAINLKNLAVSSTVSVCEEDGSDVMPSQGNVKPASVKQKSSIKLPVGRFG